MSVKPDIASTPEPVSWTMASKAKSICNPRRRMWCNHKRSSEWVLSSPSSKLCLKMFELCSKWTWKFALDGCHGWAFLSHVPCFSFFSQPCLSSFPRKVLQREKPFLGCWHTSHMFLHHSYTMQHYSGNCLEMEKAEKRDSTSLSKGRQSQGGFDGHKGHCSWGAWNPFWRKA